MMYQGYQLFLKLYGIYKCAVCISEYIYVISKSISMQSLYYLHIFTEYRKNVLVRTVYVYIKINNMPLKMKNCLFIELVFWQIVLLSLKEVSPQNINIQTES